MVDFTLYLITDRHRTCGKRLATVVEEALKGGIKAVQLREKDLSAKELFELAQGIRDMTRQHGAKFFINDRVDIALAVEADGVHLGQNSFSANDVKQFLNKESHISRHACASRLLVGVSTHSLSEAEKAEGEGADFVTFGPIFYTQSKADYGEPLGVKSIKKMREKIHIPVFAIGGINKWNIKDVIASGADGAAVISAIMETKEAYNAVKEIFKEMI